MNTAVARLRYFNPTSITGVGHNGTASHKIGKQLTSRRIMDSSHGREESHEDVLIPTHTRTCISSPGSCVGLTYRDIEVALIPANTVGDDSNSRHVCAALQPGWPHTPNRRRHGMYVSVYVARDWLIPEFDEFSILLLWVGSWSDVGRQGRRSGSKRAAATDVVYCW